ncbi:MAG: 1-(5-phosphoribosyl)-5-[Clostridia bacterium]|nr:1-(5-phosphoribosyl)-5-[(5-phosphoribosylamino)methylideneamino]imidazole-4-carboxamide isomerase [Clostridia bacterium]
MLIFPAIDLYEKKAVRLYKGDYAQMTVYSNDPLAVAKDFEKQGATCLHLVDLEGAKSGETPNLDVIASIVKNTSLFTEVGGGIRNMETVRRYLDAGVRRVILGTAAVKDPAFLQEALSTYGEKVAVGIDLRDGKIAIKGWTETAEVDTEDFLLSLQNMGLTTVICTDIAKDGAMQGANHALYKMLSEKFSLQIVASGGVSSLDDVKRLSAMNLYGAIIGKAYYTGAIDLREAIEVTKQ